MIATLRWSNNRVSRPADTSRDSPSSMQVAAGSPPGARLAYCGGAGRIMSIKLAPGREIEPMVLTRSGGMMELASRMDRLGTESAFEVLTRAKALEATGRT